jgi:opacity protein-like surface antigen
MFTATKATPEIWLTPLRRLFLTGTSLMVLTGSTLAADLPVAKAPPAVLPSWAGFYLGVHGGYGWNQDAFSQTDGFAFVTPQSINGIKSKGALFGAQAGYNWQFGRAVTGLEIDFSATNLNGSSAISETVAAGATGTSTTSLTVREKVQYVGSARARLGWLPTDNVLLYGTAGLAWERLDQTAEETVVTTGAPGAGTGFNSQELARDKFGWVAGIGAEAMLGSPNWIGRIEYLHYDLGQVQTADAFTRTGGGRSDISTAGTQTIEVVRAGVSYKFGEPATVASVPYVKAPVAAPLSTWAGFYIGAHGGYGWGHDPSSFPLALFRFPFPSGTLTGTNSKGWVAGGQFGHNWQYDRFVTGLEVDLSAADIKGTTNTATETAGASTAATTNDEKVKYLGTFRGRLGWLPTDTVLLYGTAGLAWERFESGQSHVTTAPAGTAITRTVSPSDRFGWVAGVGGEVMLGSTNWIGRLEYLHYDFGRVLNENADSGLFLPQAAASTAGRQTIDLVRVGASYKFGPDGPAVAAAPAIYAKAPPMPPPLQSWAGFYIGGHGGYGWEENDFSTQFFTNLFLGGIKSKGWLGGGQAGYNWQCASADAGFEIDGSATGIKGSSAPATIGGAGIIGGTTQTLSDNVKYLATVRGRLGWTPASNWLLYATGGLASEAVDRTLLRVTDLGGGIGTRTNLDSPLVHFGWVAGAGVESFIGSSNWIARLEYLHYDFGTVETAFQTISTNPGIPTVTERGGRQTIDTVRAGVSYKFTP